jgi:phosphate uptake regulator
MAKKADFTLEEWQTILSLPQVAGLYLALASPSGPLGLAQEMIASTKGITEALKATSGNELIDAVAADIREKAEKREKLEPPLKPGNDLNKMKAECLQAFRDVAALLSQKAPADAERYKQWVYQAAQNSANAAREGGVFGIGGERVSEAEAAALKDIAAALELSNPVGA